MALLNKLWNASPRTAVGALRRRFFGGASNEAMIPRSILIPSGPLTGRKLWLAPDPGSPWKEMADGVYDDAMFRALGGLALEGGAFWDIGAHVGYHSLSFAALGGERCQVLAFEPNPFNRERLARNLELNRELAKCIGVIPVAVAARDGELEFVLSPDIESGMSSGSFLEGAQPPRDSGEYASFLHQTVVTVSLDSFCQKRNGPPPAVLKIDVEGGEQLVLEGSRELISRHKPLILMEVHTIQLMFYVQSLLIGLGYQLEIIDDIHSSKSRCFVMARARK